MMTVYGATVHSQNGTFDFLTGAQCGVDEQGVFVHRIRMRPPKAQGCRCGMAEVCGHMLTTCPQTSLDTPR